MIPIMIIALETAWLLLPAAAANLAPVFAARFGWLPQLARPVNERYFGTHKTWRGLGVGLASGAAIGYLLALTNLGPIGHLATPTAVVAGLWIAAGALAGDLVKSFFKRRFGLAPGTAWRPWDQIDFVIGALIAAALLTPLTLRHIASALFIFGGGSLLTSYVGVKMKLKTSV